MTNAKTPTFRCGLCGKETRLSAAVHGDMVHAAVQELILAKHPAWSPKDLVCQPCLREFRAEYVEDVLARDKGEITALEEEVVRTLREHEILAKDVNAQFETKLTFGEHLADRVASFGGSWGFILVFAGVLFGWIVLNTAHLLARPFDPFPYILLNLVLSCIAAIQAPVIMMSQNRQEAKDRLRSENDYRVNLKAELEIRHLHAKLDQLLTKQWQRLLEIQKIQFDMLEDLHRHRRTEG